MSACFSRIPAIRVPDRLTGSRTERWRGVRPARGVRQAPKKIKEEELALVLPSTSYFRAIRAGVGWTFNPFLL